MGEKEEKSGLKSRQRAISDDVPEAKSVSESESPEAGKEENQRPKSRQRSSSNRFPSAKPFIPGLDFSAKVCSPFDENLAPLNPNPPKTFQYGQTNFFSINTDHPQWSPGLCLDLDKYEGIFKVKSTSIHQKVHTFCFTFLL